MHLALTSLIPHQNERTGGVDLTALPPMSLNLLSTGNNGAVRSICVSCLGPAASSAERVYGRRDLAVLPKALFVLALERNQPSGHALPPAMA